MKKNENRYQYLDTIMQSTNTILANKIFYISILYCLSCSLITIESKNKLMAANDLHWCKQQIALLEEYLQVLEKQDPRIDNYNDKRVQAHKALAFFKEKICAETALLKK